MADLQYPVGKFQKKEHITAAERAAMIDEISATPSRLRDAVKGLSAKQLDTPYRPEGWTVRQVVHHVADSHMNAYIRFKLALTEEQPTIKPYNEKKWAELQDNKSAPVEVSLSIAEGVHQRWDMAMRAASPPDFARTFRHPEMGVMNLDQLVQLYHWHGQHHVAHITGLRQRNGWN